MASGFAVSRAFGIRVSAFGVVFRVLRVCVFWA